MKHPTATFYEEGRRKISSEQLRDIANIETETDAKLDQWDKNLVLELRQRGNLTVWRKERTRSAGRATRPDLRTGAMRPGTLLGFAAPGRDKKKRNNGKGKEQREQGKEIANRVVKLKTKNKNDFPPLLFFFI